MAQRDLNPNGSSPEGGENVTGEQDDLPMPRTPASTPDRPRSRGKTQHPQGDDEVATTPPAEHVEPGTKPDRNTM